jgi:hypothetical protein
MQHCIKPGSKLHSIKSKNFRPGRKFTFILPQANYHSAKPIIILAQQDYH